MSVALSDALAGEWFRLRRRRSSAVALAATAAVGFLGSVAPRVEELARAVQDQAGGGGRRAEAANAFVYLATGAKGSALVAGLFVALAAAGAIAGEAHAGTLRLALCRPIPRTRLFAAKFLALAAFLEILLVAGLASAAAGAALVGDFGPVVVVIEKSSLGAMAVRALFAALLSHLSLLGVLGFALLASTLARNGAAATSATLGFLVISSLLVAVLEAARPYLFAAYASSPFDVLRAHALGIDAPRPVWFGLPTLQEWADVTFAAAVPASSAGLLSLLAARAFSRRDWLT